MLIYLQRILKIILTALFVPLVAASQELELSAGENIISPTKVITLENNILFTNLMGDSLLIGTDFGEVLELKLSGDSPKLIVKLPNIKSYYSESYAPKVYSIDKIGDKILILSEGDYGAKNLFVFFNGSLEVLPNLESFNIKKAAFVNAEHVFLGLASNEIVLYDLKQQQNLYRRQLSEASFSDFALDIENGNYVVTCESGILYFGTINNGNILAELEGENKDNIYQLKMSRSGDVVHFITAGQDRNVGVYKLDLKTKKAESYGIKADFLVYSVGLSADCSLGAYMQNERSEIAVFRTANKEKVAILKGHTNLLNNIIFVDSAQIISSEDGKSILVWNL